MRTIWLASYPKSGNTWFRMLIANLSATDEAGADINRLSERGAMASARGPFDFLTLIDSGLLTLDEIDSLRPCVYEELARGAQDDEYDDTPEEYPVRFAKTHDAYTRTVKGEPLLAGARGADGAILIVRDPRDVAPSLANHLAVDRDRAIAFMCDVDARFCGRTDQQPNQLRQLLPRWDGFTASWLDQTDIPVHLVRYEDLQADTETVLSWALDFAGMVATPDRIRRAVALAAFSRLQQQERSNGFREAPRRLAEGHFFRRGQSGAWKDELAPGQTERIEAAFGPMMRRLGYALSCEPALVRAG
jgi:aryl sulfotransferase